MRSRPTASSLSRLVLVVALAACSSDAQTAPKPTTPPSAAESAPPTDVAPSSTGAAPSSSTPRTDPSSTDPVATDNTGPTAPTPGAPSTRVCVAPSTTTPVTAAATDATGQDWDITSFDGAVIRAHWFPLTGLADDAMAPTVLMGPGWGSSGDTNVGAVGLLGEVNIATLRDAGFNVLTWDPRGFGESTGTVEVDSPDFEGRDVQQLLDWVATQQQTELDADRDPRVGMVGASYGGGIQLVTAAIDCRIDAIVPIIAWHSLSTSLFKADTPKTGWAGLLAAASAGRMVDPTITRANLAGQTGVVDPADVQWFTDRGPGDSVDRITVPTLIIQGTVDNLFTLDEGVTNFNRLAANGVPTAMLWFCGGHGTCLTPAGDKARPGAAAIAWLEHYVKGETDVDLIANFEFVDQDGISYTLDEFPAATAALTGTGTGRLQLVAGGGAGPATAGVGGGGILDAVIGPITPGKAANAVNVSIASGEADSLLVGAPQLSFSYSGTGADGVAPTRVFAQLVDDTTGLVLGNQVTPIAVTLDGQSHTVDVALEMIAFTAHPGTTITLQIVATTVAYAMPRLGGSIDFQTVSITLPVVTGALTIEP